MAPTALTLTPCPTPPTAHGRPPRPRGRQFIFDHTGKAPCRGQPVSPNDKGIGPNTMLGLPATQLFEADDAAFEYVMAGAGAPSVVLINGSGGPVDGWHRVFASLSNASTTFAYNRPGLGRSTKPIRPQTANAMAEDLRRLLLSVGVPRPWVLVGHSFGGLVANLFARQYADDVSSVVMLEATAPEDVLLLGKYETLLQKGFARVVNILSPLNPNHEALHALTSVGEIATAPEFPPLPLTVITGTKPAMAWATDRALLALRARHQRLLASLSPLGVQLEATKSGHFPQFSEPELVTSAVLKSVVNKANPRASASSRSGAAATW